MARILFANGDLIIGDLYVKSLRSDSHTVDSTQFSQEVLAYLVYNKRSPYDLLVLNTFLFYSAERNFVNKGDISATVNFRALYKELRPQLTQPIIVTYPSRSRIRDIEPHPKTTLVSLAETLPCELSELVAGLLKQ